MDEKRLEGLLTNNVQAEVCGAAPVWLRLGKGGGVGARGQGRPNPLPYPSCMPLTCQPLQPPRWCADAGARRPCVPAAMAIREDTHCAQATFEGLTVPREEREVGRWARFVL